MSRATPQMRDLAGRTVAHEISQQKVLPGIIRPPAFFVCEKLGPQLATLMGRGGCHALLSRALALSRQDVEWLRSVLVTEAGSLGIADDVPDNVDAKELTTGSVALVAELLGLLCAFIGDNLTLRLVRDVWPTVPFDDLKLPKENKP